MLQNPYVCIMGALFESNGQYKHLMTRFWRFSLILFLPLFTLIACDPMAPQPTPFPVIVTSNATATPTPTTTLTPRPSNTPSATPTENILPTATIPPCINDGGELVEISQFRSPTAGGENLRYNVYIPPCYAESQKRFPYVILLHGLSYREQQWEDIGVIDALEQGIRLGVLPPMILVMPYFGSIGALNTFPPDSSYETVILDELLPAVEAEFCTWNDREHRAFSGISRGAFWAFSIGFRHPDVFGILGGHSSVFPDDLREVPAAFNPLEIAENSSLLPEANLRIYLDNGASDSAASSQRDISERLRARSIAHTYIINPVGDHSNEYWSAHVSEYLEFYGRNWARSLGELPDCAEPSP